MVDFKKLAAQAVASGKDMTQATQGGGDYTPPAEGPGLCRLVAYVELGKQKVLNKGKEEIKERVQLVFELVGKRHATPEDQEPHRITVTENLSLNEKANLFKLFNRMNYTQSAKHMAELLGEGFRCEVLHDKWTDRGGKERISAVLKSDSGYNVFPPRREDEDSETGWVTVEVPKARSDIRVFLWDHADMEQWASLYIEGGYAEKRNDKGEVTSPARSKNVFQDQIKRAVNFVGSPMHTLLLASGAKIDIPEVGEDDEPGNGGRQTTNQTGASGTAGAGAASSTTSPSNDALGGIV
jgi:hypothetical protein